MIRSAVSSAPVCTPSSGTPNARHVSLGAILDRGGWPGAGGLFVVLAAPGFLPLPLVPTGVFAGTALALLAVQMMTGARRPWLPGRVRELRLPRAILAAGVSRMMAVFRRIGLSPRPRLAWAARAGTARAAMSLSLLVAGIVLVLPLPFGNQLPSLAAAAFGLALLRRDGFAALLGHVLTLAALGWAVAIVVSGSAAFGWLLDRAG